MTLAHDAIAYQRARRHEAIAREIVKKWIWDCGDSLQLNFVQSELLQQRIVEALKALEAAE
jgi:hypothetical protein